MDLLLLGYLMQRSLTNNSLQLFTTEIRMSACQRINKIFLLCTDTNIAYFKLLTLKKY